MRYLVGTDNNTWRLPDAIQAAAAGGYLSFRQAIRRWMMACHKQRPSFEGKVTLQRVEIRTLPM